MSDYSEIRRECKLRGGDRARKTRGGKTRAPGILGMAKVDPIVKTKQKKEADVGQGYWVLIWDGFGAGLVMLNPRLLTDGVDLYGNPRNWFPLPNESLTMGQRIDYAIKDRGLPWLDGGTPPADWEGGPPSSEIKNWKVIAD